MMGGLNEGVPMKTNGKRHCCPLCRLSHHCVLLLIVLLLMLPCAAACHAMARYRQSHHRRCLVSCCCGCTAVCHAIACRVGPSCRHRRTCRIATVALPHVRPWHTAARHVIVTATCHTAIVLLPDNLHNQKAIKSPMKLNDPP